MGSANVELGSVTHVSPHEAVLLFGLGVSAGVALPRVNWVVVVVAPFGKVIGKLQTWSVCAGILKVDNDELLMSVGGQQERRGAGWKQT